MKHTLPFVIDVSSSRLSPLEDLSMLHGEKAHDFEDSFRLPYVNKEHSQQHYQQQEKFSLQDHQDLLRINNRNDSEVVFTGIQSSRQLSQINIEEDSLSLSKSIFTLEAEKRENQQKQIEKDQTQLHQLQLIATGQQLQQQQQQPPQQFLSQTSSVIQKLTSIRIKEIDDEDDKIFQKSSSAQQAGKTTLVETSNYFISNPAINDITSSNRHSDLYNNNNNILSSSINSRIRQLYSLSNNPNVLNINSNNNIQTNPNHRSDSFLNSPHKQVSFQAKHTNSLTPNDKNQEICSSSFVDTFRPTDQGKLGMEDDDSLQPRDELTQTKIHLSSKKDLNIMMSNQRHIQLIQKIQRKFISFAEGHTLLGRTKILNNSIRRAIDDRVDFGHSVEKLTFNEWAAHIFEIFLDKLINITRLNHLPLIDPENSYKIAFNVITVTYNCFFLYFLSIEFFFEVHFGELKEIIGYIAQASWITEMLIAMNTCLYHENNYITDRKEITRLYFQEYILFEILPLIFEGRESTNVWLNILLHLPMLLKLKGMSIILKKLEFYVLQILKQHYFLQLFKLIMFVFLIAHVQACFYNVIELIESDFLGYTETWVTRSDNLSAEVQHWHGRYLVALFWSFSTLLNSATSPITEIEILFTCFCMIISCLVYGYSLSMVGQILTEISKQQKDYKKDLNVLNQFMKRKNITIGLRRQANISLQNYYAHNRKQQEEETLVIKKIQSTVVRDIFMQANSRVLKSYPILSGNFSKDTLDKVLTSLEEMNYAPRQTIIDLSEFSKEEDYIYFISSGEINICLEIASNNGMQHKYHSKQKKVLSVLKTGQSFGEYKFFTGMESQLTAQSKTFSSILRLSRVRFLEIVGKSGGEFEKFCEIKDRFLLEKIDSQDLHKCYVCEGTRHRTIECDKAIANQVSRYFLFRQNYSKIQEREKKQRRKRGTGCFKQVSRVSKAVEDIQKNEEIQPLLKQFELDTEDNFSSDFSLSQFEEEEDESVESPGNDLNSDCLFENVENNNNNNINNSPINTNNTAFPRSRKASSPRRSFSHFTKQPLDTLSLDESIFPKQSLVMIASGGNNVFQGEQISDGNPLPRKPREEHKMKLSFIGGTEELDLSGKQQMIMSSLQNGNNPQRGQSKKKSGMSVIDQQACSREFEECIGQLQDTVTLYLPEELRDAFQFNLVRLRAMQDNSLRFMRHYTRRRVLREQEKQKSSIILQQKISQETNNSINANFQDKQYSESSEIFLSNNINNSQDNRIPNSPVASKTEYGKSKFNEGKSPRVFNDQENTISPSNSISNADQQGFSGYKKPILNPSSFSQLLPISNINFNSIAAKRASVDIQQQQQQQYMIKRPLLKNNTTIEIGQADIQTFNWSFDVMHMFQNYFPQSNMVKIIRKANYQLLKKKKSIKKKESEHPSHRGQGYLKYINGIKQALLMPSEDSIIKSQKLAKTLKQQESDLISFSPQKRKKHGSGLSYFFSKQDACQKSQSKGSPTNK